MRRRNRQGQQGGIRANAGDVIVTGNPQQVIEKLDRMGLEAERERDFPLAHRYYQTAEHFRREAHAAT